MAAAEAPPYSKADISDGRTRKDANSGGNDDADSFSVLDERAVRNSLSVELRHPPQERSFLRFASQSEVIEATTYFDQPVV